MDNNAANYYLNELDRVLVLANSDSKEEADKYIEEAIKYATELRRIIEVTE